ncbi:MAG TPA: DinB family protein [Roseiflexaceae bacterium]|nr:DinB family protein [Roseiflexaceae bacterium]
MPDKPLSSAQLLAMLAAGPPRIAELTAGLTAAQLLAAPAPGEWSANEVLAHLRSCADVWGDCIATILREDYPTIRAVNPRTWVKSTDYHEQAFQPSLEAFAAQRTALLALLEPLPPDAWSRAARVTVAGRPLERTVHSYAQWMATHERPHLKQFQQIAKTLSSAA